MRPTEEEVLEYMSQWINEETWDDLNIMYMAGETEVMADRLLSSGAICSKTCFEEVRKLEREVEIYAKRFRRLSRKKQNAIYKTLFEDVFISSCEDCNHVSFVHDKNEDLYTELKTECWTCNSENIKTKRGLK